MTALGIGIGAGLGFLGDQLTRNQRKKDQKEMYEHQMKTSDKYNRGMALYNQELAKDMWEYTNYPNQVKQIAAAGLNPAMLYSQGGQGGQTAGAGEGGAPSGSGGQPHQGMKIDPMTLANMELVKAQAEDIRSQTEERKGIDAAKKSQELETGKLELKLLANDVKNTGMKNDILKLEREYSRLQNEAMNIANNWETERVEYEAERMRQQNKELLFNNELAEELRSDVIQASALSLKETAMRIMNISKDSELKEAQVWATFENVLLGRGELAEKRFNRLNSNSKWEREQALKEVEAELKAQNPGLQNVAGGLLQKSIMFLSQGAPLGIWRKFDDGITKNESEFVKIKGKPKID